MHTHVSRMSVGDLFDRTFRVFGKTFLRNSALGALSMLPGAVVLALGARLLTAGVTDILIDIETTTDFMPQLLGQILPALALLSVGALVFVLGFLLASTAMMIANATVYEGGDIQWPDALRAAAGIRWVRVIWQTLLYSCALAGIIIAPYALMLLAVATEILLLLVSVPLLVASIFVIIFLVVRWMFCRVAIAWEGSEALRSFGRSAELVRGNWWRTLGIMLLFSFVAQFAISLITAPIMLAVMWDFYASYFDFLMQSPGGDIPPDMALRMIRSFGVGYVAAVFISSLLTVMFESAYVVIMYFDLRERRGEFEPEESDAAGASETGGALV